ncbi:MAG: hypothetical protein DWQ01_13350 [Planctomycetota bacterium]|nr:MAG: hypothetical protein DWQ01_13350 [Planctomycetota bacterium]
MDFLEELLRQGELIFWILLGLGSAVASWLKKRAQAKQEPPTLTEEEQATLEEYLSGKDFEDPEEFPQGESFEPEPLPKMDPSPSSPPAQQPVWELEGDPELGWKVVPKVPAKAPPPVPVVKPVETARAEDQELGQLAADMMANKWESGLESHHLVSSFDRPEFTSESQAFGFFDNISGLGWEEQPGTATSTVGPSSLPWLSSEMAWRDAIILREVLGPPRSFSESDIPGFR